MPDQNKPAVAILGLGRMGAPITAAFLAADYPTTVWNRTAEKADALVAQGATRAATAAEAITAAALVIVPLLDYGTVRQVLEPAATALSGRVVVNLANGTPDQARRLAAWTAEHGAGYLDGAMMALPETVATSDAFFLYSGSEEAFTTHRLDLEVMAAGHYFGSDPGSAETHDLAILGTGYAALAGFLHAAALLDAAGTDPRTFAPLAARWLNGMAAFLPELAREATSRTYGDAITTVDMNLAAVAGILHVSRAHGIPADVHEPLKALLDRRSADGHGEDSFSSVYELLRYQGMVSLRRGTTEAT